VAVDRGRVVAYGSDAGGHHDRGSSAEGSRTVDLGAAVVLPGLVNAHTHLELSYLRDEVPPSSEFITWIHRIMAARRERADPRAPEILEAVEDAVEECVRSGTALVADISNTLVTFAALARSPLAGIVLYELIRFSAPDPAAFVEAARREVEALGRTDRLRAGLAAHAPYSVSPLVFRAIRSVVDRDPFVPCSVHLAESVEELEFVRTGRGPWRQLLEQLGVWDPAWVPPGSSPVQFLDEAGFLDGRVLAVHGVQMTMEDLKVLASRGATLVTCPRSNGHTGAGAPPIGEFYESGVRVAVGTDSLASAPDLNLFAELATMRALAPDVPASKLVESATIEGARALGFDGDYGTIEPGKIARLAVVDSPGDVDDVEEYLVSGIRPEQVRWIES
jgi:cytosine/adenosine deaminase-related metal-dependent hydrolase